VGGGGGNILRSLKNLFRRDLIVTQKTDPRYAERVRRAIFAKTSISDAVQTDFQLLLTVGNLWGAEALGRLRFTDISPGQEASKVAVLLQGFRH